MEKQVQTYPIHSFLWGNYEIEKKLLDFNIHLLNLL